MAAPADMGEEVERPPNERVGVKPPEEMIGQVPVTLVTVPAVVVETKPSAPLVQPRTWPAVPLP